MNVAIILAGGSGKRMKLDIPKQFLDLEGKAVIAYSLLAFEKSLVDKIIIVAAKEYEDYCKKELIERYSISKFIGLAENGSERVYSVENGLKLVEKLIQKDDIDDDINVLIHDGARPLVSVELINRSIDALIKKGSCIPAIPLNDTIKETEDSLIVKKTLERDKLRAIQTPQAFALSTLQKAYAAWDSNKDFIPTDDASLVEEFLDEKVNLIEGEEKNIKITRPLDLEIASILLRA